MVKKHVKLHISCRSGSGECKSPPERKIFSHVALSSSTAVATTDAGESHVMHHIVNEVHKILLATSAVEKIYASGDTLAILHIPSQEDETHVRLTIDVIVMVPTQHL